MAKAKKIEKYVPQTKFPGNSIKEADMLAKSPAYADFFSAYNAYKTHVPENDRYAHWYSEWEARFKSGGLDPLKWTSEMGRWQVNSLLMSIWPYTAEFAAINDAFMKEYNEREDLQELYQEAFTGNWYVYDRFGNHIQKTDATTKGYHQTPESYVMYRAVVNRSIEAGKKIELARETPYMEGDLVLLRKPYIGRRNVDPFYVNPYSEEYRNGARTPDESTMRVATILGVTERVGSWRVSRGSKVLQIQWIGVEDSQIIDIEERYVKWHERPTYKNGMKVKT
jgi:hypothetical protein